MQFEAAAAGDLADRKAAALGRSIVGRGRAGLAAAGEAPVVLLHHAAAFGAGRFQRCIVARDRVPVIALGFLHQRGGHRSDFSHEVVAFQTTFFHLGKLELPVAGQLGFGQILHVQAAQQRHQLEGLGCRDQLAAFAQHVLLCQQAFDRGRAGGWCAQAFFVHRRAQLFVVDQLAGTFHRRQQRGFGIAGRRFGLQCLDIGFGGEHHFTLGHRHQIGIVFLDFLAVDGQPARFDQHLAVGLEVQFLADAGNGHLDGRDPRRHRELGRREEHRQEALDHQVIELGFDLAEAFRRLQGRDDGEVIRDLGVVEDLFRRLDIAVFQGRAGMLAECLQGPRQVFLGDHRGGLLGHFDIVLGQEARVGPRVGQHLVFFVQGLRQRERGLGRKTEARIGLALQGGQVVQTAAALRGRFRFLADAGWFANCSGGDRIGIGTVPEPVSAAFEVIVLLPFRVEPFAFVLAGLGSESTAYFPVVARDMLADFFFTLDHDRQSRRLHPTDRRQEEAAITRVECGQRARAVDADQPVGFRAAARRVGQRQHLRIGLELGEAIADRLRRHRLQPEPVDRLADRGLGRACILNDQAEDQLTLAARVTGIDQVRHVLAADQLDQRIQAALDLVDRVQVEMRRYHRQVGKTPFAALDVEFIRRLDLDQMANRRADHIAVALEIFVHLFKLAGAGGQRAHDVLSH